MLVATTAAVFIIIIIIFSQFLAFACLALASTILLYEYQVFDGTE